MTDLLSRINVKQVKKIVGALLLILPVVFLLVSLLFLVSPSREGSRFYLETVGLKAWAFLVFSLVAVWGIDWVTDKNTINTILTIDKDSPPLKVFCATLFLSVWPIMFGLLLL